MGTDGRTEIRTAARAVTAATAPLEKGPTSSTATTGTTGTTGATGPIMTGERNSGGTFQRSVVSSRPNGLKMKPMP